MSKRGRIIAAVVALVVVGAVVAFVALGGRGSGPEIETATVTKQELAVTVTASGKVEAGVRADVFPPAQGTLDKVYVKDGQKVKAGKKLAVMDTRPLELQVAQARAGLSQAKAQLAAVKDGTSAADLTAARANVTASRAAYGAALEQADAVGSSSPSQAQIDAAEAGTAAARTAYNNANAAYQAYPSNDATKAALTAARDQTYAAYLSARAAESQLKNAGTSAAQAQADAGVAQAFAAWKGAQAQLSRLQSGSSSAQRAAAEAGVASAAEALDVAQRALEDSTLRAPIDGVVIFNVQTGAAAAAMASAGGSAAGGASAAGAGGSSGDIDEGTPVSPAAAPFSVIDLDALKFTAEVDEADIDRVKVGMNVDITLDSFPGDTIASQVVRVNPVAQPTATGGTIFEVEIALDDTGKDVLIGMKGDATIKVSSQAGALTIPVEALFSEGGTDYVYVVENSKLKKTEISVGATTDTEVEVLQGLNESQVVALSGSTQYVDGMQVRVKE